MNSSRLIRRLLLIPPVAAGILVLVWLAGGKEPPTVTDNREIARHVRIIEIPSVNFVPTAEGYGSVQPARVWTAVAEVAGRIIEMHDDLRNGSILPAGAVLIRIDPVDYELTLARDQAELAELDVQAANARASLEIEQRNLKLAKREFKRISDLVAKGTTSRSDADTFERNLLGARSQVQNLDNTLSLIPLQRRVLEARVAQSLRDIEHATIKAPFDLRVANLTVETDQFVGAGKNLFEGDSIDRVEVVAQVAMSSLRNLLIGRPEVDMSRNEMNERLAEFAGFKPLLRLDLGSHTAEWEAEFVRMSDIIDPHTRTVGVVVAVDNPFALTIPGMRPPLSKGMFLQVLIHGHSQSDRLVVPRSAIRNRSVLIADADNRLRRRSVEIAFEQDDLSVVAEGLTSGDRVVVSDLIPVVEGMLLAPEIDENLTSKLRNALEESK